MASNLDQPEVLIAPFAYNGDRNTIPALSTGTQEASLEDGFPRVTELPISEGGIPPQRIDFNGLGYLLSSQFFYLQNGGKFTFNQQVSDAIGGYPKDCILQYTSGEMTYQVVSLINNNTYNFVTNPNYIDGVHWKKAFEISEEDWVTIATRQIITGPKVLSGQNQLSLLNPNIRAGTAPSSTVNTILSFVDREGVRAGEVYHTYDINKGSKVSIQAVNMNNESGGDVNNAVISVINPPTGLPYTYAPSPINLTTPNQMVTTDVFKNIVLGSPRTVVEYGNSISSGVVVPSTGLLIVVSDYGEYTLTIGGYPILIGGRGGNYSAKDTIVVPVSRGTRIEMNARPISAKFYY